MLSCKKVLNPLKKLPRHHGTQNKSKGKTMLLVRHQNAAKQGWDFLVILATLYACVEAPLRMVMQLGRNGFLRYGFAAVTIILLADVAANFFTEAFIDGKWSDDFGANAKHYLRKSFARDVLSALPFELFALAAMPEIRYAAAFGLLRLLRVPTLLKFTRRVQESHLANQIVLKIAALVFWIFLIAHWIACGWIALGTSLPEHDAFTNYNRALYWCITTLATVGYGDITPQTNEQRIYTMLVMILGAGLYGYIIGNVANILAKRDLAKMHHLEKMERINAFLSYRKIPQTIQNRIRSYYSYLWESRLGYDETAVLSELPPSMKEEVALFLNREIIEKVALFKGASEEMIRDLVVQLKPCVFTPSDYVFKAGEIGQNMYFICRGKVEVTSRDGKTVFATLSEGNFFGEAALLTSQPRNASVRATEYCDMYTLDKSSFDQVLEFYPEFAKHIRESAEVRAGGRTAKAS